MSLGYELFLMFNVLFFDISTMTRLKDPNNFQKYISGRRPVHQMADSVHRGVHGELQHSEVLRDHDHRGPGHEQHGHRWH